MEKLTNENRAEREALAKRYEEQARAKTNAAILKLEGKQQAFLRSDYNSDIQKELGQALKAGKKPSEFFRKCKWLFGDIILKRHKDAFFYAVDTCTAHIYTSRWYRRTFRSDDYYFYYEKINGIVTAFKNMNGIDADYADVLEDKITEEQQAYKTYKMWLQDEYLLAYEIDAGNKRVIDFVKNKLSEGNNLRYNLLLGIFMSKNAELHELVCKLLLAARLQEGLRQAICETCDSGRFEPFLMVLKTIRDNDLIRYSSVKRAVGCWTGLMTEETKDLDRISGKTLDLIIECLEKPAVIDEYLKTEDSMKLYIALWATACREVRVTEKKLGEILENGTSHQALTAGVFFKNQMGRELKQRLSVKAMLTRYDELDVMAVWLPLSDRFTDDRMSARWSDEEAEKLYVILNEMLEKIPKGDLKFEPCVFPWNSEELSKREIVERLCVIAADLKDDKLIDETCVKIPLIVGGSGYNSGRAEYVKMLLSHPRTEIQLDTLVALAADKEEYTREKVFDILKTVELNEKHFCMFEDMLKYKASDLRQGLIDVLFRQEDEELYKCVERLSSDKKEEKRTAALDMIIRVTEGGAYSDEVKARYRTLAENIASPTSKEKILIDRILSVKSEADAVEGYGLYKNSDGFTPEIDMKYIEQCKAAFVKLFPGTPLFGNKHGKKLGLAKIIDDLDKLIEEHKNEEYLDSGSGEKRLLANTEGYFRFEVKLPDGTEQIAFKDLWDEFYKTRINNEDLLFELDMYSTSRFYGCESSPKFAKNFFGEEFTEEKNLMHRWIMDKIFTYYSGTYRKAAPFDEACALAYHIAYEAKPDNLYSFIQTYYSHKEYILYLDGERREIKQPTSGNVSIITPMSDARVNKMLQWLGASSGYFKDVFSLKFKLGQRFGFFMKREASDINNYELTKNIYKPFSGSELILAAYRKVISMGFMYKLLITKMLILSDLSQVISFKVLGESRAVSRYYNYQDAEAFIKSILEIRTFEKLSEHKFTKEDDRRLDFTVDIAQNVINTVLNVELVRGDTETEFSRSIGSIRRIFGAENFVRILSALGKDTLDRSSYFSSYGGVSKKQSLSYLLGVCVPVPDDNAEKLRELVKKTDVTENRIVEAALFSPAWLDIAEEYLGWKGFKSACYYFIAHMNESLDEKTKAIIAKYTPLTAEELNIGAFDIDWFKDALKTVGEKRFDTIYKAAKYISDGGKHTRARKYADAVMGKLSKEEATKQVTEKRNKDTLMAYALIPLDGEKDMVERYLFIQEFKKGAKKFGAQRRASESAAADCALRNLAENAGFEDVSRLTLRMETALFEEIKPLLEWNEIDEIKLKIALDENGKADILCEKGGKSLKSVPSKYNKNERVMEFAAVKKQLTEQYRRTRQMFEEAMENETEFTEKELSALCQNPAIKPIITRLVYKSGEKLGFLNGGKLTDFSGREEKLGKNAKLKVAHPFDLYKDGHWHDYQKYLFDNEIAQPFKQIFRELYVKTDEEAAAFRSTRYAGNQIQPLKAKACLKTRRWVADVETGLQKVYYKENIVATMYALADWFSPADIEAPTLEWVEFFNRRTGAAIRIEDIPDIIFSEVMRDVDLAVSVAHAGGVDPETSHSTIETRSAIIEFTLPLFKLKNVRLEGSHAFIKGERADYSIHLGSGVVHLQGGPMINILPVHSQHRGKLFLPFVDEDPKTAQIISEILLFAEDKKIKDPFILDQIK